MHLQTELSHVQRVRIALKAAEGLACLHRHNRVHMDIKAAKLLCDLSDPNEPSVVLADMGLSKHKEGPFTSGLGSGTSAW
jgi:serine/threonine protein kinase